VDRDRPGRCSARSPAHCGSATTSAPTCFHLAGEPPGLPSGPPQEVPQGVLHLLDRLDDTPAYVLDAKYDGLAWNAMAVALVVDFAALPPKGRNAIRWFFEDPASSTIEENGEYWRFACESVADLRAAAARYPDDPGIRTLIADLSTTSELFTRLWDQYEVKVRRSSTKRMLHSVVGPLDLHCDILFVPDLDQKVVLYTAAPGTSSHEALRLLRVVGTQDLTTGAPGVAP
jgi:hypothetical protein